MAKTRVQLDLEQEEAEALDAFRRRCGLRSRADAVRTALAIIAWVERESSLGRQVVAVGSEQVSHLVVPGVTGVLGSREE